MNFENKIIKTFLFENINECDAYAALSSVNFDIRSFMRDEVIYSKDKGASELGFVLSGKCEVRRLHNDGSIVPLNVLGTGGSFGIISVLNDGEDFPTQIVAKCKTEVAFLGKDELLSLMRKSPDIAINVARFLAGRVCFLNDKVSTFSGTTCEEKLVTSILSSAKAYGTLEFPFNRKRTAESISCGRASLYRALDSLKCAGLVDYDNKKIYIKDPEGLERIGK